MFTVYAGENKEWNMYVYTQALKWQRTIFAGIISQARLSSEIPACDTSYYSSHVHYTQTKRSNLFKKSGGQCVQVITTKKRKWQGKDLCIQKKKENVYRELEILASVDTKSMGGMGWLKAWPLVKRAPLMHWIEDRRKEKDRLHPIQMKVLL